MTDEDYVASPRCPRCGCNDIIYEQDIAFGGDFLAQNMTCEACWQTWVSIYTLTGFDD